MYGLDLLYMEWHLHPVPGEKHIMEDIQCGIWGEKLLRQAKSHDSFERISIFIPMGGI